MMTLFKQLRLLHMGGYLDSEETLRDMTSGKAEFEYMKQFIAEAFFDFENDCEQLRSLWTAYCIHCNLECDTARYDSDLRSLYEEIGRDTCGFGPWSSFSRFDEYMCRYLV